MGGRERISSQVRVGVGGYLVEYEDMWWDMREDMWWDGSLGGYLVSGVCGVGGYPSLWSLCVELGGYLLVSGVCGKDWSLEGYLVSGVCGEL